MAKKKTTSGKSTATKKSKPKAAAAPKKKAAAAPKKKAAAAPKKKADAAAPKKAAPPSNGAAAPKKKAKAKSGDKKPRANVVPWSERFKDSPGPWTCPKCGPLPMKAQPLYGEDEKHHCPNVECDQIVTLLTKEDLEPAERRGSWPPQRNKNRAIPQDS